MNGTLYSHDPSDDYYAGNNPVYRKKNPSTLIPNSTNIYMRHSYSPATHGDIHCKHIKQSNSVNQRYTCCQQQRQRLNVDDHTFRNDESSTEYYDRIRARVCSSAPGCSYQNPPISSIKVKRVREIPSIKINRPPQQNPIQVFPQPQVNKIK